MKTHLITAAVAAFTLLSNASRSEAQVVETTMPDEAARHEGTWLQWPHHYTYGAAYRSRLDSTWVAMTRALVAGEKVHIIAYNAAERTRISKLLSAGNVPLANVNFVLRATNDVWVRDNGPVFVKDNAGTKKITDWGFNGWGFDTPYAKDNTVPAQVSLLLKMPKIALNDVILEGGAIELDGNGVLMATRSSILEPNRNPDITEGEMQDVLTTYLGAKKFIWLDGADGGQDDITDMHIDGFAKFAPGRKLVTLSKPDLAYWGLSQSDINKLYTATDIGGAPYSIVQLPLTARDVVTTYGTSVGFKGSYANYYVANKAVLVPTYADANDSAALTKIQALYPGRIVVGIDCRNLYINGGMVHCVTQQQPE
jgi:agmatine deiminase